MEIVGVGNGMGRREERVRRRRCVVWRHRWASWWWWCGWRYGDRGRDEWERFDAEEEMVGRRERLRRAVVRVCGDIVFAV